MIDFARPEYLSYRPWLAAYAALAFVLLLQLAWAQRRYFESGLLKRFGPAFSPWRAAVKLILWTAAGWYLLIALATPLGPAVKIEGNQSGADLILAIDVSSSMYAQDLKPNRLAALKQALDGFFSRLGGDRVGIVAFAGEAVVACPLTSDYDTASLFLNKLETDSVPRDGTGLGPALKLCLDAFAKDAQRGRLILLATDGEDTAGTDVLAQARRAVEKGVPVYTFGIGTPEGAYVPDRPDIFGRVMAKTYKGQPVRTRLDPSGLKQIAALTGGQYFEGASASGLAQAYDRIRQLKQGLAKSQDRYVREPLFERPLLIALLLLLLECLISVKAHGLSKAGSRVARWFRTAWRRETAAPLALLFLAGTAMAGPRSDYNQGNVLYRQGQYQQAVEAYQRGEQSSQDKAAIPYNLGNAKFKLDDFQGAVESYEKALAIDPQDEDARHNLEIAKRKMQQQEQPGQKGKPGDKGQGKQSGQGQQGQGQGQGQGQSGQAKPGQGSQTGQGRLNSDQAQAMMNMLRNDQKRFSGAFNPTKKFEQPDKKPKDQFEQMFEQMTGMKTQKQPAPAENDAKGEEVKNW